MNNDEKTLALLAALVGVRASGPRKPRRPRMADEIAHLRDENAALRAAVERVRALHTPKIAGDTCPSGCQGTDALIEVRVGEWEWPPCPTLRAVEGTP